MDWLVGILVWSYEVLRNDRGAAPRATILLSWLHYIVCILFVTKVAWMAWILVLSCSCIFGLILIDGIWMGGLDLISRAMHVQPRD